MVYEVTIHLLTIEHWCHQVDVGRVSQSGISYEIIRTTNKSNAFVLLGRLNVWFVTTLRAYCNNCYLLNTPHVWQHLLSLVHFKVAAMISMKGVSRLHFFWGIFTICIRICIRAGMCTFIHVKCLQVQDMNMYHTEMIKSFYKVCPIFVHMHSTIKAGGWRPGW